MTICGGMNFPLFNNLIEKLPKFPWRSLFEKTGKLKGLLSRVPIVTTGRLSVEVGLALTFFVREVATLIRKSGFLFTALYLKQCSVCLQRDYAGYRVKDEKHPLSVSLTRLGIPRIIPVRHRHIIACHNERSDYLVQLYLSWFTLSKIRKLAKPISKATLKSIIEPTEDIGRVREVGSDLKQAFSNIHRKYLPWISTIPLEKGMTWMPTWKSTPNDDRPFLGQGAASNILTSLKYEIASFAWNVNQIHSIQDGVFSPGMLWVKRVLYPLDNSYTTRMLHQDMEFDEKSVGPAFASVRHCYEPQLLRPGRLAQVIEGAGKRRIFAIGNYIKQRLLHPVHK